MSFRTLVIVVLVALASTAIPGQSAPAPDNTALRTQAIELYRQSKYIEALPLFEKLVLASPDDKLMHEGLGVSLVSKAATMPDAEGKALRIRARKEFLRARELGDDSDIVAVELELLPPDGALPPISQKPEAQAAMNRAEACFAQRDMDCAIAEYTNVLKLEPRQYDAALFLGDSYFVKHDLENAARWFSFAVAIDPNRETAYRYWADALLQAGKQEQAREKFIEAFITLPYSRATQAGLKKWADKNLVKLVFLKIESPNSVTEKDGNTNITIDPSGLDRKDGATAWLTCDMSRALWRKEKFQKQYPQEKQYRHSLAEEVDCLSLTAKTAQELLQNKSARSLEPALAILVNLHQKGLIESYILLNAADNGIAQDFEAYRDQHRDRLRQYVREYMLPEK
jgi:tetratricopeptide (TPR) repeat protein